MIPRVDRRSGVAGDAEGREGLGAERAVQFVGVLDAPVVPVPAAVAERGRGGGEDREKRRVFAHVRYFRGPRAAVAYRDTRLLSA